MAAGTARRAGSRCVRWNRCCRACVAGRMCDSWRRIDHRRVGGWWRTSPRRSSWRDEGWSWSVRRCIVPEERQAPIMPALTGAAHLDAVEHRRSADESVPAWAESLDRLPSWRWKTLCSTQCRTSDKRDRQVSPWVAWHTRFLAGSVYCRGCAHLLKWIDRERATRNLLAAR